MKFCTKCGAQLNDDAKFCPKCGASIGVQQMSAAQTEPEMPHQSVAAPDPVVQQAHQFDQPKPEAPQKETGKKSSVPLIIGIIAAVVVLAVAGIFVFKKLSGPDLVGTWQDAYGISSFTFNKDGSCSIDTWGDSVEGTYEVKNGVISMTFADFLTEQFPYEIDKKNKDRMTLYDPDTGEGLVYTRVKEGGSGTEAETEAEAAPETAPQAIAETVPQSVVETTAAVSETTSKAAADPFEGFWYFGKTELTITKLGTGYKAEAYVHDSAAGGFEHEMTCTQNGDSLYYTNGTEAQVRYSENFQDGEARIVEYTGMRGSFTPSNNKPEDAFALERDSSEAPRYLIWEKDPRTDLPASAEYICWYSSALHLSEFDISFLSSDELRIARNEIYARHGRKFASADLQQHFNSCSWYRGTIEASDFNENMLTQVEKDNVKFIEAVENGTSISTQTYSFSAAPYQNGGYEYGVSSLNMNNGLLTVQGVINGSYQTMSFQFDNNTKFYSSGGDQADYEISSDSFFDTLGRMNGLEIVLEVAGGRVVSAALCS